MDFKEQLKKVRKDAKRTQKQVAAGIGVAERNYQEWEYGKTKHGFDSLLALADFFDVSLDYLVGRSEVKERR